jgi:acyl carrier protein
MDDARETVRLFLRTLLDNRGDTRGFGDADSLILSGRLQSIDVLDVLTFLETRFGIEFSTGFDQLEIDSVSEIVRLIQRLS